MRFIVLILFLLSGCASDSQSGTEKTLQQHKIMLDAITFYISNLQKHGKLPTPAELESNESITK